MKKHGLAIEEILVALFIYLFILFLDRTCGSAITVAKKKEKEKNEQAQYSLYGPNKLAQWSIYYQPLLKFC